MIWIWGGISSREIFALCLPLDILHISGINLYDSDKTLPPNSQYQSSVFITLPSDINPIGTRVSYQNPRPGSDESGMYYPALVDWSSQCTADGGQLKGYPVPKGCVITVQLPMHGERCYQKY